MRYHRHQLNRHLSRIPRRVRQRILLNISEVLDCWAIRNPHPGGYVSSTTQPATQYGVQRSHHSIFHHPGWFATTWSGYTPTFQNSVVVMSWITILITFLCISVLHIYTHYDACCLCRQRTMSLGKSQSNNTRWDVYFVKGVKFGYNGNLIKLKHQFKDAEE